MSEDTELVSLKNEIQEMKEALSKVLDLFQDFFYTDRGGVLQSQ